MYLKRTFTKNMIVHICNKSISNYEIFRGREIAQRFINTLDYYNHNYNTKSFSDYEKTQKYIVDDLFSNQGNIVKIITYAIMPDHYHLLIRILNHIRFSHFVNNCENSFTRYFNLKHKRKGPLWQSRFRFVPVYSNEILLHISRYIHLNPVTSNLVEKAEQWEFSSYRNYIYDEKILHHVTEISIGTPSSYKKFVEDQKDYQRKLRYIKKYQLD